MSKMSAAPPAAAVLASRSAAAPAACATAVAAARLRRANRIVNISLPGGELSIEWRERDDHVLMTGPVEYEGAFILDEALFETAAP